MDDEAHLVARWSLTNLVSRSLIVTQRLSLTKRQTGDGYPGLVQIQTALLDELAERIAQAVRDVST